MKLKRETLELGSNIQHAVIWLHGLGADGNDFVPIVPELGLPKDAGVRFIFPHAPSRPVTLNNGMSMPAWYDIISLDRTKNVEMDDLLATVDWISVLIDEQVALGIDPENIILAGFSQGGVLALHTALRYSKRLGGIVALSTYFPFADETIAEMPKGYEQIPVFTAHGTHDPVIPVTWWHDYAPKLEEQGFSVVAKSYPMEHSVHPQEIVDLGAWFKDQL
ncbi:alpha/beta hydrolase [Leucothrix arctica]|uniref:Carboxylesterase n=1 Tax=Leucothrix arctica TaxID=1481894 RepID=A0A317C801_9GAMM|nr:alpha/beta fold hydrolase [Leucothrix arctica]PWQ94598.1 carboxylesterase [Leucothrix arctica]